MNRSERLQVLSKSLAEANRKAEQERADKQQVERIAKDVQARIATAAEKAKLAHRIHASDDGLICPGCGYWGPESDFEPDDEESDGFSTDDETSETGGDDNIEELDAAGKKRVVAEILRNHKRRR